MSRFVPVQPPTGSARRRERGSVLIVALLLSAIIAIAIGSYLTLNVSTTRQAKRTFDGYAALNLAEAGAEEAVWTFNQAVTNSTADDGGDDGSEWDGWSRGGNAAWKKISGFDLGNNTNGWVKVYVSGMSTARNAQSTVVTQATVGSPSTPAMTRMIEVTLRRRSLFANGLVARQAVTFAGSNASVDSWNSDPDSDPATPPVAYDPSVRTDHGSVATLEVVNSAIAINQADVWGYVSTGGGQPAVGTNGTIRGTTTPPGVNVDPNRIATDFNATLNVIPAPTDGTFLASLPPVLGFPGVATKWRTPNIALSGNQTLTILGDVTLVLTAGSGSQAINIVGNGSLIIGLHSSLTVYFEGDVKVAGRGLANPNTQPASCQMYGTNNSVAGQSVDIAGNGALRCVFYGPNADVKINGNGDVMGAYVARNITLVGNAAFHYDEALGQFGNSSFGMVKWREITDAAGQAQYAPYFSGW